MKAEADWEAGAKSRAAAEIGEEEEEERAAHDQTTTGDEVWGGLAGRGNMQRLPQGHTRATLVAVRPWLRARRMTPRTEIGGAR